MTFAHISDLHIDVGERATTRAQRLISALLPMRDLDAVLVTGDIADHGTPPEYQVAAELLTQFEVPVLMLPGNHDVREAFGPGLLGLSGSAAEINQLVRVGEVDFLLCDSVIPGESGGSLSETTLTWLKATLADREGPALVAFHHPPAILHIPFIDRIRQTGEQRLAALVAEHADVAALICGHAHTAAVTTFAGRPLVVGPAASPPPACRWKSRVWSTSTVLLAMRFTCWTTKPGSPPTSGPLNGSSARWPSAR